MVWRTGREGAKESFSLINILLVILKITVISQMNGNEKRNTNLYTVNEIILVY